MSAKIPVGLRGIEEFPSDAAAGSVLGRHRAAFEK
jgi:hypothetical protein